MNLRSTLLLMAAVAATAACGDDSGILPASIPNTIDTVTLSATRDTILTVASGYSVSSGRTVPTQNSSDFDFVYNVDDSNRSVFLTTKVLGMISNTSIRPGFQPSTWDFDSIQTAPINNYVSDDTVRLSLDHPVWYVRSALVCTSLSSPIYGKLELLSIDSAAGTVTFRTLIDLNCGYHSLRVGTPKD